MSAPAPAGIHHLAIAVRDLATMRAFYEGVLGLPILRRWPAKEGADDGEPGDGPESELRSIWLDLGSGAFVALERTAGAATARSDQTPGLQMVALHIAPEARADWQARLAAAGVAVVHQTAYTIYVRDPEGNRIGLSHWPDQAPGRAPSAG
jgi:glyoxylase I family protein